MTTTVFSEQPYKRLFIAASYNLVCGNLLEREPQQSDNQRFEPRSTNLGALPSIPVLWPGQWDQMVTQSYTISGVS